MTEMGTLLLHRLKTLGGRLTIKTMVLGRPDGTTQAKDVFVGRDRGRPKATTEGVTGVVVQSDILYNISLSVTTSVKHSTGFHCIRKSIMFFTDMCKHCCRDTC